MNQIAIAMFALAFVRLASGQACLNAQTALVNNPTCASAVDAATVCMGTCRTLYDDIISNCDDTTPATYINLLDTLCSPCAMAVSALTSDATCINATDVNTICMGTCRTLYDNIISNCDNATIPGIATVTNICTPCGRAQSALISDTTCANITDANTLCMGTCRILYDDIISSCDSTTASDFVITIDTICGPCGMALSALESDTACINATDANTLCMGTCRGLYDNIISNCNATISAGYNTTISTLCSGGTNTGDQCGIAGGAIDDACLTSLGLGDNTTCTGSCGSQLATAAAACTTSSDEAIQGAITTYNGLCGFEAQCTVATNEFNAVSTCEYALQSNDVGVLCSASCRSLLEGVQNSCPTFTGITQDALNQGCDESGSEVLRASGIITLLLVAIFAFIV